MIFGLTLAELWEIFQDIWATGNRWARWAIAIIVGWPILLLVYALWNPPIWSGSLMALIPVIALFILIMTRLDPMVLAVLATFKSGRTVLKIISTVVGVELFIGVYCTLVKIGNDPELAMLLILFLVTYIFLAMGVKGNKFVGFAKSVCVLGIIILTAIFIFGGRKEVKKMAARKGEGVTFITKGEMEDGYWVVPEKLSIKPRVETENVVREKLSDNDVRLIVNCRKPALIYTLAPGESIQIRHIDFGGWEWKNRCSYNAAGSAIPIYGERYKVTRPRFRHDLPFPEMPAGAVGFSLEDENGKIVSSDYIKNQGGIIYFNNTSGKTVKAMLRYNYMKAFTENPVTAQQIGWDGSTATFVATRF